MKVRKMDSNGDYLFGLGSSDYYENKPAGVGQTISNRLRLWTGEWFLDTGAGTPWLQEILGEATTAEAVLRTRILETEGVNEILEYASVFDPNTRRLTISATVDTIYGTTIVQETL